MYLSSQDCMLEWFANWPVLQFLNAKRKTIMGRTEHWSLRMRSISVLHEEKKQAYERKKQRTCCYTRFWFQEITVDDICFIVHS